MLNRSIAKRVMAVFLLVPSFMLSSLAASGVETPRTPNPKSASRHCSDRQIVKAIQKKIKMDKQFNDQRKHINVDSRYRVVKLEGWVKGADAAATVERFANETGCRVKKVDNQLADHLVVSCGPGQKVCGDGCIDQSSRCNLIN
jgi:osmotically-inducible protein OsmY